MQPIPTKHRWRYHWLTLGGVALAWLFFAVVVGFFEEQPGLKGLGAALAVSMLGGLGVLYATATTIAMATAPDSTTAAVHGRAVAFFGVVALGLAVLVSIGHS